MLFVRSRYSFSFHLYNQCSTTCACEMVVSKRLSLCTPWSRFFVQHGYSREDNNNRCCGNDYQPSSRTPPSMLCPVSFGLECPKGPRTKRHPSLIETPCHLAPRLRYVVPVTRRLVKSGKRPQTSSGQRTSPTSNMIIVPRVPHILVSISQLTNAVSRNTPVMTENLMSFLNVVEWTTIIKYILHDEGKNHLRDRARCEGEESF